MKKNLEYRIKILLFSLFLFVPFLTNATAQSEIVISLDFANAPLSEVLNEISRQTSLSMVYNAKDVDPNRKVTIHANREKLSKVMTDLLKNTNTTYSVRDNHLVVYSTKETQPYILPCSKNNAQLRVPCLMNMANHLSGLVY